MAWGNAWESRLSYCSLNTFAICDVVDQSGDASLTDHKLCQFWSVFTNVFNQDGCRFLHGLVRKLERREHLWKDLHVDHCLCQIRRMSGDVRQENKRLWIAQKISLGKSAMPDGHTCRLSFPSECPIHRATCGTAPASTTSCASSALCFAMSPSAEAAILLSESSCSYSFADHADSLQALCPRGLLGCKQRVAE